MDRHTEYTVLYMAKSMWIPLQMSGFVFFNHTDGDRCIKSSTQPCNLHRQTLTVEWLVLKRSATFNVAPSYDATFPTSQFVKFLPCWSYPGQL